MLVVNIRKCKEKYYYVGRGNPLGNQYRIGIDGTREEVIAQYEIWLLGKIQKKDRVWNELTKIKNAVKRGEVVRLGCFCAPKKCHAEVIKKYVELMIQEEK